MLGSHADAWYSRLATSTPTKLTITRRISASPLQTLANPSRKKSAFCLKLRRRKKPGPHSPLLHLRSRNPRPSTMPSRGPPLLGPSCLSRHIPLERMTILSRSRSRSTLSPRRRLVKLVLHKITRSSHGFWLVGILLSTQT